MKEKNYYQTTIAKNTSKDSDYYSPKKKANLARCKEDPSYLGEFLIANENLIWHTLHRHVGDLNITLKNRSREIDKEDLLQVGRAAMIRAVQLFDPNKKTSFISYAITAIQRELLIYLRDNRTIRPTRRGHALKIEVEKMQRKTSMSTQEICEELEASDYEVGRYLTVGQSTIPLEDLEVFPQGGSCPVSLEEENFERIHLQDIIDKISKDLSLLERRVLDSQLKDNTKTKTAKDLGISQVQVYRILKKIKGLFQKQLSHPS